MSDEQKHQSAEPCQNCGKIPATRFAPQRTRQQQQRLGPRNLCEECYQHLFGPGGTETSDKRKHLE